MLFASATLAFIFTLPFFHPENIFRQTQSRLQTSSGVLLTRLAALRPLTPQDEKLRQVLDKGGLEARLLYARFGPDVLLNCPLATPGDLEAGRMYLLYALPGILGPHILHLAALGIATSSPLTGIEGSSWRGIATIAGVLLAVAEMYYTATYDSSPNALSTRLNEIDFIYWKLLLYRGLAVAFMDAILGWMIWLQATGRAFLTPPSTSERLVKHARVLEILVGKSRGLGIVRNGVVRDAGLRRRVEDYWVKEGEVMRDVFEEPEVLDAQRKALGRLDKARVDREADMYLEKILGGVQVVQDGGEG